jgi:dTMP kinase
LAELRDSSLVFSLESLMAEERSRIEHERVAKEQRERAAAEARASHVRLRIEAEAFAAARERARLAEEERRCAEEQARLDAIRAAELERVRADTARRLSAESEAAAKKHELELAVVRNAGSTRTLRLGLAGTAIAALGAFVTLAWLELGVHPQRLAALEAEYASLRAGERTRAERAEELFRASEAARRDLESRLRARDAEGSSPPAAPRQDKASKTVPGTRPPKPRLRPKPCVADNDPLNPCL